MQQETTTKPPGSNRDEQPTFYEAEVAEIFERAAELQPTGNRQLPPAEGMTLSQLQEIGREVGISPEALTLAAQAVAVRPRCYRPLHRHASAAGTMLVIPKPGESIEPAKPRVPDSWWRQVR